MSRVEPLNSEQKRERICQALVDAKAQKLVVLDVREVTILADYFLIATGTSSVHIRSLGRSVRDHMKHEHAMNCQPEGDEASSWVILDYGDVVAHVFSQEMREFYGLEKLWSAAPCQPWNEADLGEAAEAIGCDGAPDSE